MTPAALARAGEALYGRDWRAPLARALGTSTRYVQAWERAERRITDDNAARIRDLMRERGQNLLDLAETA